MSYWIKNRLCWLAVCTIILIGGVSYLNKVQEMYPEKDRDVTLVEAWTYYGNDREEWDDHYTVRTTLLLDGETISQSYDSLPSPRVSY